MNLEDSIQQKFGNKIRIRICGILIQNEKILLVKQNLGLNDVLWSPPGGGIEFGESIHTCLQREFREETGLIIKVEELLKISEFINPPLHAIELFFKVSYQLGEVIVGIDPELMHLNQIISDVRFLSLDEVKSLEPHSIHTILKNISSFHELTTASFDL